jgi:hypothetical protein
MINEDINSTVIFLDVRNFTPSLKEFSKNPKFFELINDVYKCGLVAISSFCKENEYYINSTGDGFLAVIMGENHYIKAYLVGLILVLHTKKWFETFYYNKKDSKLYPCEGKYFYGIGMESGHVEKIETPTIANKKVETYLGNVINISARIEALSKEHGRAPMLFGPTLNNLLSEKVLGVPYNELIEEAKNMKAQECANVEYAEMNKINLKLLSSYIFEHNLKGVDNPIPIFRLSPTQLQNLKLHEWEFLKKIPSDISETFVKLYKNFDIP